MAFSLGNDQNDGLNEMNLIPLIDIMLVLMIIFLVTATVLNPTIALQLPDTAASVNEAAPKVIRLSIDKEGKIFWDKQMLGLDELSERLGSQSDKTIPIHLRADKEGKYDGVAQVLGVVSQAGLHNIAFVSE